MAPTAWNGLVFVGNAGGDLSGVIGHVVRAGRARWHVVWRFDVVPVERAGARDVADGRSLSHFGRGVLDVVHARRASRRALRASGNPAPDYDIAVRDGENLYTNSLIALDAATASSSRYNQLVKHDFHDWDVTARRRSSRHAAAADRRVGEQGRAALGRRSRGLASSSADGDAGSEAMPLSFRRRRRRARTSTRRCRATARRASVPATWAARSGTARRSIPRSTRSMSAPSIGARPCSSCPNRRRCRRPARSGSAPRAAESMEPPASAKGWLTAFDADNGAVRWKFAAPRPMLAGVTPTAGGLVFAADLGGTLYAFDADERRGALAADDRTVDGRRHRELSRLAASSASASRRE